MGYPENTAVSGIGQNLLNDIFDLIYLQSDAPKNQIARMINNRSQVGEVVDNFKTNAPRIVTLMKRFMKGNTHVPRDDAGDSGIFICNPLSMGFGSPNPVVANPTQNLGCGRRDHLWWWEWLDFGIYNSYSEWGSSVGLSTWEHNYVDQTWDKAQMVVARVRCNSVNTCDGQSAGCGTTWIGSGNCPNPKCSVRGAATKSVGCGKTSYAMFHVKLDKPVSSYWHFSGGRFRNGAPIPGVTAEMPKKTISVMQGTKSADDEFSSNAFYRFYWMGLPGRNEFLTTFDQCMSHIPYIQIGYRSNRPGAQSTRPGGYVCNSCKKERMAPPYNEANANVWNTNFDIYPRKTQFRVSNYPGDQHGGLCMNIGDVPGRYAGLDGNFGCICGGIYEPRHKIPAIPNLDYEIYEAKRKADLQTQEDTTTTRYVNTDARIAGSGDSSNKSIYGRGAVITKYVKAVKQKYGGPAMLQANISVDNISSLQSMRANNAYPFTVPLSKMRYAFTNTPLRICTNPTHMGVTWTNPSTGQAEVSPFRPLLDRRGQAMDYCPDCGINGNAKFITIHPQGWLNPARPYTITSTQPLTEQNTIGIVGQDPSTGQPISIKQTFLERPQWTIVMRDLTDDQERYNLRIELPQVFLGDIIPNEFTPQPPPPTSDNRPEGFTCPNERQGPLAVEMEWLMANIAGDDAIVPDVDNMEDDDILVTETVNAGDDTLKVEPVIRVNVGDFLSGGPYGSGTRITEINGSRLTIVPPASEIDGLGFDSSGRRNRISQFEAPFTVKFISNTNADNPLTPNCCDGVQASQYTFLVTEGKSASGFYSTVERDWVDTSPLVNYGDTKGLRWTEVNAGAAGETNAIHTDTDAIGSRFPMGIDLNDLRSLGTAMAGFEPGAYRLPSPIKYGDEYQWCNLESGQQNQMVQDMFANANRMMRSVIQQRTGGSNWKIEGNHRTPLVEESEVAQSGVVQKYYKCETCSTLANIGLVASQRGMATNLLEALENNTYFPGYATIRFYQNRGDLSSDSIIIQSDGTIDLIPDADGGTLTQGYLEGAFLWETTSREGLAASWYNWAIRFLTELSEGGDYRIN